MQIGYGILVDTATHNFVRKLQLELHQVIGIGLARQPPHITVKSPFAIDDMGPFSAYLSSLATRLSPFTIDAQGFGTFGEQVLYLDILPNKRLNDLHELILEEMNSDFGIAAGEYEGPNIKFHISVAGFRKAVDFQAAQQYISRYQPAFSFPLTQLGVFYYLGPGQSWIVSHQVKLSNQV